MLSRLSYIFCAIVMICGCFFFYPKWNAPRGEAAIGWDVSGYYWYIPSVVIYKDLKYQRFADTVLQKYQPTPEIQQFSRYPDSSCVLTYSSGMAFMYLPLFTVAHILAKPLGYPPDGFSPPYQFALQVGSMLFALFGLWYFRKLLRFFFEDKIVAILLLLLVIGTNYLNYASIDGPMTHSWLFTLYTFLFLNTYYFYRSPAMKYAIRIGLLNGLMILIRPSEMVGVLIPILWGMETISMQAIREKLLFFKQHLSKLLVAVICVILVGSIQMFYWKYVSGHWLVFSYGGDDKGFTWLPPHTDVYMFSYRSGWIRYTPLMLLALIGIIPFLKNGKNKVAIMAFLLLNLYVVSAWDIWWYGGRAMIQSYVAWFFPMGALVQTMFQRRWLQWIMIPVVILFSYINIWMIIQAHRGTGLLDVDNMTKAYYMRVIGRWHPGNLEQLDKLKDTDELFEGTPTDMKEVYSNDFESDTSIHAPEQPIRGNVSDYVSADREYSSNMVFALPDHSPRWLRVTADFRFAHKQWEVWKMPQFVVEFMSKGKSIKRNNIRPGKFINENETKNEFIDVKIPKAPFDSVKVYFWSAGSNWDMLMDNVSVSTFNEK
ncbi:MAG: hypothetical protein J0H46_09125 [Bacteroidetes bacterium]|nr:hypothetical protein [Bacteroidota bacterium]